MKRLIEEKVKEEKKLKEEIRSINSEISKALEEASPEIGKLLKEKDKLFFKLLDTVNEKWDLLSNNHFTLHFKSLSRKIDELKAFYEEVKILFLEIFELSDTIKSLNKELSSIPLEDKIKEKIKKLSSLKGSTLYSSFERLFRDKESVYESLKKYADFFKEGELVIDLGAGRGEFVEILEEKGVSAIGVEKDDGMIKEAEKRGIKLIKSDINEFLNSRVDGSIDGIFSSQVIEHLEYPYLETMIKLAYKKLKEGGKIILETVNPLSWFSFSQIFLLDPTHKLPIHPLMIKNLLLRTGFRSVEIIYSELPDKRLKEVEAEAPLYSVLNENFDLLNEFLFSHSVFAVLGEK